MKSQMVHVLVFALVLQIHSLDQPQDPIVASPSPPSSPPSSPRTPIKIPTEKLIVDRLTGYLADSDKVFVLRVIDALLSLNGHPSTLPELSISSQICTQDRLRSAVERPSLRLLWSLASPL